MKLLIVSAALFLASCLNTKKAHVSVGFDEWRVMGELPIYVDVQKAKVIHDSLLFEAYVHVQDPDPLSVEVQVSKFINGVEQPLGLPNQDGIFKTKTSFSDPDTFSFTSLSYRKIYLYIKR